MTAQGAVFLSYASQDVEAARKICEALRSGGVEVWFDADGGLEHGDEWDAKIRKQIKECVLFIPIISANTQARHEGYFRLEWDLAAERARTIASGIAFILPVVVDDTREPEALVPDRFRTVQWTRLPGGAVTPEVKARYLKLWSHRIGAGKHEVGVEQASSPAIPVDAGGMPALRRANRRVVEIGLAATVLIAGACWWVLRPRHDPLTTEPRPRAIVPAQAQTKIKRQVEKVWEILLSQPMPSRGELEVASELCKRAVESDGTDADVWATWAHVESLYISRGIDMSAARQESAREKAARAMQLASKAFEPRFAHALTLMVAVGYMTETRFTREAESVLRQLLQEKPDEPRVLLALAYLVGGLQRLDESVALFERLARDPRWVAAAYSGMGWQIQHQRPDEAFAAAEKSIGARAYAGNLSLQLKLALEWVGDLDLAKQAAEKISAADLRGQDKVALDVAGVYWWRREPKEMLHVLRAIPRDWLQTQFGSFDGPKDYWVGLAHEMNGDTRAAQRAWRAALTLLNQRQAEAGAAARWGAMRTELQIRLGDVSASDVIDGLRKSGEVVPRSVAILRGDFDALRLGLEKLRWSVLRNSPEFDPLRQNPRFQSLLAEAEKDPKRSPRPKMSAGAQPPMDFANAKSIAVLAFENLSGDKENEYFSDGISEELLNVLAKVPGLRVAARTSAFYFKGKNATAQDIGQKLGVAHLVDGSVRRAGTKVRIAVRLSRAETGEQLWGESYEDELKDVFALQDRIAREIAQKLQLTLGAGAVAKRPLNPEAHRLVLEGRHFFNQRSEDAFTKAEAAFTRAIATDPGFAPAHEGLALVCAMRGVFRQNDGLIPEAVAEAAKDLHRARASATRALELDPARGDARAALARLALDEGRVAEAERECQLALSLNANSSTVHQWHAVILLRQGQLQAALDEFAAAVALDPLATIHVHIQAHALKQVGRFEEALALNERAGALRTDVFVPQRANAAFLLLKLGRTPAAVSAARSVVQSWPAAPRFVSDAYAIWVLRRAGHEAEAAAHAEKLLRELPPQSYVRGNVLVALGRFPEALPYLEHTPENLREDLFSSELYDPWRNDPRFATLLKKLGCAEAYQVALENLRALRNRRP